MAPVAGHLTAAGPTPSLDTPSARRTTWPHTGQDARSSGRSIRRSFRLVTTSSTLPQGRPYGRPPAAAVLGRQHHDAHLPRASPFTPGGMTATGATQRRPRRGLLGVPL